MFTRQMYKKLEKDLKNRGRGVDEWNELVGKMEQKLDLDRSCSNFSGGEKHNVTTNQECYEFGAANGQVGGIYTVYSKIIRSDISGETFLFNYTASIES